VDFRQPQPVFFVVIFHGGSIISIFIIALSKFLDNLNSDTIKNHLNKNTEWSNEERTALIKRGPADTVMALALIHHLAIGNNLPIRKIAKFFAKLGKFLIIEFVPKKDSQVKKLLASREDIFLDYSQENFEHEFRKYFELIQKQKVKNSLRTIYLYKKI